MLSRTSHRPMELGVVALLCILWVLAAASKDILLDATASLAVLVISWTCARDALTSGEKGHAVVLWAMVMLSFFATFLLP